jgi:predicted nucleic acid-binding protein
VVGRTFVLDVSMAFSWFLEDEFDARAEAVLGLFPQARALVPSLWVTEMANALRSAERRRRLTQERADRILEDLLAFPIAVDPVEMATAWRLLALARQFDLTPYDAAYLELALRENLPLATRDGALDRAAAEAGLPRLAL